MYLVIVTSKLGSKKPLDRVTLDKDSSWAPFLVSTTFYLACIYLSFLICCFKLALFTSFPLGVKILPFPLYAAFKTDICSKASQSFVILPGDKFELVPTASLFLPHAASQGSAYSLHFTGGVQGSKEKKPWIFNRFECWVICLAACLISYIFFAESCYFQAPKSTTKMQKNERLRINGVLKILV